MIEHLKQILVAQFEAALAMLKQCVEACPAEHWEDKIANETFRWNAYHALFFADLYLSPSNESFELRDLHLKGGDERGDVACVGLSQEDMLAYIPLVRQKMLDNIAAESAASFVGPSGFSWYIVSRAEMHLNNIRHIQHHAAQLSAYLRRVDDRFKDPASLRWIRTGWK
jgi:hypothetical protein